MFKPHYKLAGVDHSQSSSAWEGAQSHRVVCARFSEVLLGDS